MYLLNIYMKVMILPYKKLYFDEYEVRIQLFEFFLPKLPAICFQNICRTIHQSSHQSNFKGLLCHICVLNIR